MELIIKKVSEKNAKNGQFFWEMFNEKSELVARSEAYQDYDDCVRALVYINLAGSSAVIIDETSGSPVKLNSTDLDIEELDEHAEMTTPPAETA